MWNVAFPILQIDCLHLWIGMQLRRNVVMTIPLLHPRFGVYPSQREMPISRLNRCGDLWLIHLPRWG